MPLDALAASIAAHVRSLVLPQPTDVISTDRFIVKLWFNGRIPEARVVDLAKERFPLVGGCLDVGHRTRCRGWPTTTTVISSV
jgi:anti-sigma factor RsiW